MRNLIIASVCVVLYLFYMQLKDLRRLWTEVKHDTNSVVVINSIIKDKLDIKDNEIRDKDIQIAKYNANFEAFNGTGCANCHLDVNKMLPYPNKDLTFESYVKVVRQGIPDLMPAYVNLLALK